MIKLYKNADEFSNFHFIEYTSLTHNLIKDYYIQNKWIIDEFNLTGIRWDKDQEKDWYNDVLIGWTWDKIVAVIGTTDPGRRYAKTPLAGTKGVAHVKEGFYPKCYKLWFHNASKPTKHAAFVQVNLIDYWVDTNANFQYDETNDFQGSGVIAVNFHADVYGSKMNDGMIGYASAGCQVVQDNNDLKKIIKLYAETNQGKRNLPVNYGLINAKDINVSV